MKRRTIIGALVGAIFLLGSIAAITESSGAPKTAGGVVKAKITIKDRKTGKSHTFLEVIKVPAHPFNKSLLSAKRLQMKGRTQVCDEVCKTMCYGNNPQSGDWACYLSCRWHCRPAMGGDPRKKIKAIQVLIEVE
ncbi:MAG: hypothetical protein KJ621_01105 [Proteobacteria bacterium]|nr:hypothetical protein [Pseudomonadota bacterium]